MKRLLLSALLMGLSVPAASDAMYEATTKYSDREREPFNLLEHLDWQSYQDRKNPSDSELEAAGIDRSDLDIMSPYIPGARVKQLYPILESLQRDRDSDGNQTGK